LELKGLQRVNETVTVTATIEIPKQVYDFLSDFAKFAGTTLKDLLNEEMESLIKNFYQGGFYEDWSKDAFRNRGVSEYFEFKK
jgi:hypothetical protein